MMALLLRRREALHRNPEPGKPVTNGMRLLCLLFLGAVSALPQSFSFGVKAGVPLTDFFSTVQSPRFGFNSNTKRYIVGPMVQLGLPAGFALEFDALYRRLNYESRLTLVDVFTNSRTTGNAWEFPLLLKYRFHAPLVRPYVGGGVAWDTLSGLKQSVTNTILPGRTTTTTTSNPAELQNTNTVGAVAVAGIDVHALFLHISPEVRYTYWGTQHFRDAVSGLLHSNRNQAEFLVGFTF